MTPVTDPKLLEALNGQGGMQPVRDPAIIAQLDYGIDVSQPDEVIRKTINGLPETEKKRAHDLWADHRVTQLRNKGFDQHPDPSRGIPFIGPYIDEGVAGIQSILNTVTNGGAGMPYDEALAFERARERQAQAARPGEAAAGQIAAGITTGAPLFSRIATAPTLIGRMGQGAALGAGTGAVEGFGAGEGGVSNRIDTAASGAEAGAVTGGMLPMLASGANRVAGAAYDMIAPTAARLRHGPEQAADVILANRIAREGSSPAGKRLDLQNGQAYDARLGPNSQATLPETIADTSDAMQRLTGTLYRQGGEAGNLIKQTLQSRQRGADNRFAAQPNGQGPQGQMERVVDDVERALQIRSSDSARRTEQQIMRDQAREGQRLYDIARNSQDDFDVSPVVMGMALRAQDYGGGFRQKINQAISLFRDEFPQRRAVNTIKRFDASKKALDDMIEAAGREGNGNLRRELTRFKNELLDAVHRPGADGLPTINRAYHDARQAWGSAAENREAIDLGRASLREGSEVSIEQFRDLTRGQQNLFRLGFIESLRNAMGTKKPGNDITQIFQQRRVQELMREIIPRPNGRNAIFADRPERFGELMRREERMAQTNNAVLGNSATAQRHQDDMAYAGDALAGMWNKFRSSPSLFNMGIEAVGVGIQKIFGYRQDVALSLARRLLETDPQTRNQILRRLSRRGGTDALTRFGQIVDRAALTATPALMSPEPKREQGGLFTLGAQ